MKITSIKQQAKRINRYSVFVDDKYVFSLSEIALLDSKLVNGQELTAAKVREFKKLSGEDKLYNQTLRYVALRLRSRWEIEQYLSRKQASPALIEPILNKLSNIGMIDDEKFTEAFVSSRRLLRRAPRRKIIAELRQKHVTGEVIEQVVGNDSSDEQAALLAVIERKRRQNKYQDDLKLMQYLARQGFGYSDIKSALNKP